jgi:hypothetical protein
MDNKGTSNSRHATTEMIPATVGTPAKAEKPVTAGTLATETAWSIARVGTQATSEMPGKEGH